MSGPTPIHDDMLLVLWKSLSYETQFEKQKRKEEIIIEFWNIMNKKVDKMMKDMKDYYKDYRGK